MENLILDLKRIENIVPLEEINRLREDSEKANRMLHEGTGKGSDFLGWVNLPSSITEENIQEIRRAAGTIRDKADVIVVIGIGGSYLGAKAVIEALGDNFAGLRKERQYPMVVFAGQNLSSDYTHELLESLRDYSFALIVVSKSGTTTEPAIAFRILKKALETKYSTEEAASRIIAVTDSSRGALKTVSDKAGYKTFVIPDDVGGRYSVLTPVGLLPIAAAGYDIGEIVRGARDMEAATDASVPFENNPAAIYAALRNVLYLRGFKIEILASYEPKLLFLSEWWKQLFGESEGKDGKGIFPASVTLTADLHSMGQYIQEGERVLFETVISVGKSSNTIVLETEQENEDGLNFLAGKSLDEINHTAEIGVALAHTDGGVPNIRIFIPRLDEYSIGSLIYFFEKACGISGYLLDINPFDQPGVEAYKNNMFALLDKPGFEQESRRIKERISEDF